MPYPVLAGLGAIGGIRASRRRAAAATAAAAKAASALTFSVDGGVSRFLRRKVGRMSGNTTLAAVRASNRVGRWGRTRVRRQLSALLNVPQKRLRTREIRATRYKPNYEFRVYRREYPVRELRGVRFRPYKGQSRGASASVGKLRFSAYGKQQTFDRTMRLKKGGKDSYVLLHEDNRRPTRVMGTWIKADYREPTVLKAELPKRWRVEFRRQQKLLGRRR